MSSSDFTGYVLTGGKSSRMKRDKAFLRINGKTFLENAVGILAPFCGETKIVLNKTQTHFIKRLPKQIPHIFDRFENRGALGGIHAAFNDCETGFAIILAVDLPFVSHKAVGKLCEIAIDEKDFSAVIPKQKDGRFQPLAAVYNVKDCMTEIERILKNKSSPSVRSFLDEISIKEIEQKKLSNREDLFFNVNDPADFRQIEN